MFHNIYSGKRILLTGHTGFKGSWLSIWLKELGADVAGYALDPPTAPNNFNASRMQSRIAHYHGDIRDYDRLFSVISDFKPEMIFHLAAQALVRPSYEAPKTTFDTNAGGTVNVLEAVRQSPGIRVVVNITSDKCYENREWVWGYRESDPMGGHDPYSASKGCAELIFSAYLRSFFSTADRGDRRIGAVSCRAGNAIGGGDWSLDRLIPDCARALQAGLPVRIRNPGAFRPWQHVLELLSGYLWVGARLWENPADFSGVWNFGPSGDNIVRVREMVEQFIGEWGSGRWEDTSDPRSVHEDVALRLCCDQAKARLGWQNTLSLSQAVSWTAEWYKEYYRNADKADMYNECVRQIRRYMELAAAGKLSWAMNP